jgi:hypothetical protein
MPLLAPSSWRSLAPNAQGFITTTTPENQKKKKIFALCSPHLVILQIWKAIGALLLFFLVVGI